MKKLIFFLLLLTFVKCIYSQSQGPERIDFAVEEQISRSVLNHYDRVQPYFAEAYEHYPTIPKGILEAVAFTYSRFCHLMPDITDADSSSLPATYGVMGLTLDGKGVFRDNLIYVSDLSGVSQEEIIASPRANILAYAAAYSQLQQRWNIGSTLVEQRLILDELSELPRNCDQTFNFASESNLYAIYKFLDDRNLCRQLEILPYEIDWQGIFGDHLPFLESSVLFLDEERIYLPDRSVPYREIPPVDAAESRDVVPDYSGAIWSPAGVCNYSGRNGTPISSVTIHYTAGTYAGAIAWFQDCTYNGVGAEASAHYVIRSIDGQITQMVRESDKAWHVRSANPYTVGLEHEAYGDIQSYFTPEMYQASADLTRDICNRNGISPLRMFYRDTLDNGTVLNSGLHDLGGEGACIKIRGHQHYPDQSHTDPGPYWNWNYYFKLVNDDSPVISYHTPTGILTDSGGDVANYGDDERQLFLISVPDAETITLSFSEFELEDDYDFMWIYDGSSVFAPLLGRWNTQSPGTVVSSGNSLLVEFRSDCGTNDAGWHAEWNAIIPVIDNPPTTYIAFDENQWVTSSFNLNFQDEDDHYLLYRFYQVMGNDGTRWTANPNRGFFCDNFDDLNLNAWRINSGTWSINNSQLFQNDMVSANLATALKGDLSDVYMYDFYGKFLQTNSAQDELGIYFHSDTNLFENSESAYYIAVFPNDGCVCFYKVIQGVKTEMYRCHNVTTTIGTNFFYRIIHDRQSGEIWFFRDGICLGQWRDTSPLTTRSSFFSFHSNQANVMMDNFRVYRSRDAVIQITAGAGVNSDAIYQAENGTPKTKIKSIVIDDALNFSLLAEKSLKVDYTPPSILRVVNDGPDQDLDVLTSDVVSANWLAADELHSDVQSYEYQITNVPSSDLARWTSVGLSTHFSERMRLVENERYIVKVRARNSAGLLSNFVQSDGFVYRPADHLTILDLNHHLKMNLYPNPAHDYLMISLSLDESVSGEKLQLMDEKLMTVRIFDLYGHLLKTEYLSLGAAKIDVHEWSSGMYFIQLSDGNIVLYNIKFIKQ